MRIQFKSLFDIQNNNKVTPLAIACTVKNTQVVDLKKISNNFKKVKMKQKFIALMGTALVAVTLIAVTACEKPIPPNGGGTTNPQDTIYPVNIPFIDYSFREIIREFDCNWDVQKLGKDTINLINSEEELFEFIACNGNNILPVIDFTKYSLILIRILFPHIRNDITKSLVQTTATEYQLDININMSSYTMPDVEIVSILTTKLSQDVIVKLNITKKYN